MSHPDSVPSADPGSVPDDVARIRADAFFALFDRGTLTREDDVELLEGVIVEREPMHPPHAFGIAIDVSSAEEYMGKCSSTVNRHHAPIWQNHGWYWGLAFCDPMHFQFATGY